MILRAANIALAVCLLARGQSSSVSRDGSSSDAFGQSPSAAQPDTPPPAVCPAGGPIGTVDLRVKSPHQGDEPLPFRTINHLTEGDTVLYSPVLRNHEKRPGEVSLVMVPAKREAGKDSLLVTDPKPADKPHEWKVDQSISLAAFVYGAEGLNKKKVSRFLSQDDLLIAQLADYAEKTAQTEALLAALSSADSSSASMNAALTGFASQYGLSVAIDKTAPPAIQAQTLFATMNPQLATYDPITSSASAKIGQTASLTTAAASLFFGSPIGLAAGGTAMLLDLRAIAFPGTQFRSSFAQPVMDGLYLCGQRTPAPPHTRVAYIWANRIPNTPPPSLQVEKADYIPENQKTPLPLQVSATDWKYLDRARLWTLTNDKGLKASVKVLKLANQKAIELDLTQSSLAPGDYHLTAFWDWAQFRAAGDVHVLALSDFNKAKLEPSSQDKLLAKTGKTAVTVQGDDFEFTTKVEVKREDDKFATAEAIPFLLPKGLREGPQDHMDVQINTGDLDPGQYQLLITQQDGKSHPIPIYLLPNPPKIENLPILANQGVTTQHYVLKGERLGLLTKLQTPAASLQLDAATADQTQRNLTVQLRSDHAPGTTYAVTAYLENRNEPLKFSDALQITGPLPIIASSKLSLPAGLAVSMNPGEFPAGSVLTAMLDVKNIEGKSTLHVGCADDAGPQTTIRLGEQTDKWSLQQLSPDQLFISDDTSSLPAGCSVQATIDNGSGGTSQPYTLARIIRVPKIEKVELTNEQTADGKRVYAITGRNLEMLQQVGWDQLAGFEITSLPVPILGQGQEQLLRVTLPDSQAPTPVLYVWLRGEKAGRATTATVPKPPTVAPVAPQGPPTPVVPASPVANPGPPSQVANPAPASPVANPAPAPVQK